METKKEIKAQIAYMKKERDAYLKNITPEQYRERIEALKEMYADAPKHEAN